VRFGALSFGREQCGGVEVAEVEPPYEATELWTSRDLCEELAEYLGVGNGDVGVERGDGGAMEFLGREK
jgi:hypothetical protein